MISIKLFFSLSALFLWVLNIKERRTDRRYVEFQHNQLSLFKEVAFNQVFKITS